MKTTVRDRILDQKDCAKTSVQTNLPHNMLTRRTGKRKIFLIIFSALYTKAIDDLELPQIRIKIQEYQKQSQGREFNEQSQTRMINIIYDVAQQFIILTTLPHTQHVTVPYKFLNAVTVYSEKYLKKMAEGKSKFIIGMTSKTNLLS